MGRSLGSMPTAIADPWRDRALGPDGLGADAEGCMATRSTINGIATFVVAGAVLASATVATTASASEDQVGTDATTHEVAAIPVGVLESPLTVVRADVPSAFVLTDAVAPVASAAVPDVAVHDRAVQRTLGRAKATRAQVRDRFADFTLHSRRTRDVRGIESSLYRGRFYRASVEPLRRCIAERESEGHYDVVSPSGLYFGAYQVSRPLARGATWMMLREHKRLMGAKQARKVLAKLRAKPMNTWPRYWQDAAFHTVMNWERTRSGASHWAGGRWHC